MFFVEAFLWTCMIVGVISLVLGSRGWETTVRYEPRDMWVGVYWDSSPKSFDLYICLIPLIVIHKKKRMNIVPVETSDTFVVDDANYLLRLLGEAKAHLLVMQITNKSFSVPDLMADIEHYMLRIEGR